MNLERAKEIFESKGVIDVEYHGESIWLKNIDEEQSMVEIEGLNQKLGTRKVKVGELTE